MPRINIGGRQIDIPEVDHNLREIGYDLVNRRLIEETKCGGKLTVAKVEEAFSNQTETHKLIEDIKNCGGLIEPVFITLKGKRWVVRDGNRRFYCYRQLSKEDPNSWSTIRCYEAPADMTDKEIDEYIDRVQNDIGKVEWSPYAVISMMIERVRKYGEDLDVVCQSYNITEKEYRDREIAYDTYTMYLDWLKERTSVRWSLKENQLHPVLRSAITKQTFHGGEEMTDHRTEDGDFLAELEQMECEESHRHTDLTGVVKDCVVEALEIGSDQYQWWRFDLELKGDGSRRQPAADLLWWNGCDGILVGMVRPEATGFLGAARLDRDETSDGFDVLGTYASVEETQRAVIGAAAL